VGVRGKGSLGWGEEGGEGRAVDRGKRYFLGLVLVIVVRR